MSFKKRMKNFWFKQVNILRWELVGYILASLFLFVFTFHEYFTFYISDTFKCDLPRNSSQELNQRFVDCKIETSLIDFLRHLECQKTNQGKFSCTVKTVYSVGYLKENEWIRAFFPNR